MKVLPIINIARVNSVDISNFQSTSKLNYSNSPNDSFEKKIDRKPLFTTVNFMGYNVHILDGGSHGENMAHFAKAISPDVDVVMHEVEVNSKSPHEKQMKSLYEQLKEIPHKTDDKPEYIALPGLCSAPLQNMEDQYERVMGEKIKLTPENVKANKKKLNEFLKKISQNPSTYNTYTGYMDPLRQGMEWMYDVITEINRLVDDGYKVYVPSGHPEYQSLKWLADERDRKPELQHYIATGVDKDGAVKSMRNYIQNQGWYDFNLLNLSDAHTVNLKDAKGEEDYLYAAYDGAVTDGARGVYNFYPVRDADGKVKGYSYTDEYTVQYPYSEFPANDELAPLLKFVGKKTTEVLANSSQVKEFNTLHESSPSSAKEKFSKVLFNVNDVFTPSEIKNQKIELKGRYVDSSLKLFFDKDSAGCVTFPNTNCEGSDRPSVLSMWGSCFSVFNVIKKDMEFYNEKAAASSGFFTRTCNPAPADNVIKEDIEKAKQAEQSGRYKDAENFYHSAITLGKMMGNNNIEPNIGLGDINLKQGNLDGASACFNSAVDKLSELVHGCSTSGDITLLYLKKATTAFEEHGKKAALYIKERSIYDSKSKVARLFSTPPVHPGIYHGYDWRQEYQQSRQISELFDKLAIICSEKGEAYPAKVCRAAAQDIKDCIPRGDEVIKKRAEGIQYIGDLYPEIKPE